tara:strand:+ start:15721 stop:16023 length:303 start_codon:yes stop_codon:yes gene_type:complete
VKTNVSINLTDEERNIIAKRLQGKEVKSMVTRKELGDLVQGFVHGLLDYEPQTETAKVTQIGQRSLPVTAKLQMYLDKRGYDEDHPSRLGFIRGWHSAGK